ncbi:S49 family peptidase [Bradyrhizobium sp. USDA 4350]
MTKLAHIADRVLNRPLMILPDKLAMIASVLDGRISIDTADLRAREIELPEADALMGTGPDASRYVGQFEASDPNDPKSPRKPYRTTAEGVAIIPVIGSLVNRGGWLDAVSGITSYEKLKFQISAAARDPDVTSILLDIDSPGGEAVGAFEVGDVVHEATQSKEVVAVVNGLMASAAYAIGAQASRIVTTSSGISGSIGVVMMHADYSVAIANRGIKPTLIHAGARKVDGNPYTPLTDDVKAGLKAEIDRFYDLFVTSVAVGRAGMSEEQIRATEARTYIGTDAVAVGLADEVGSFESVLSELSAKPAAVSFNHPKGRRSMTQKTFTQADLDAAVKAALTAQIAQAAAATAAPAAAAAAPAPAAAPPAAAAPSAADTIKAERERFAAINALPEAKGREGMAMHLATTTDMTVDQVKAVLATAPIAATGARAGDSDVGLSVAPANPNAANPQNVSAQWDAVLKSRGLKVG